MTELTPPRLSWQDHTPSSTQYDDVYYMAEDGLAEAEYVFLKSNDLPECLSGCNLFVVGETGFGTGLNFLALWRLWQMLPSSRPRLHYLSTELHPLTPDDLHKAHRRWPKLGALSDELIAAYPPAIAGAHRRYLADGQITLDLLFGDAAEMLSRYQPAEGSVRVDAWFLDGFAPAKNPAMWHPSLYDAMAKLSHHETTLATFTAAGTVRRGLQAAGFDVKKVPGFGSKRDMTVGRYNATSAAVTTDTQEAIVIGAGIAGISSAWQLARQGCHVTLLEAGNSICHGASDNPACALTPYYPATWNARGQLLASGFYHTAHLITHLRQAGHKIAGKTNGTLMLDSSGAHPRGMRLKKWQSALSLPPDIRRHVDAQEASDVAGITLDHGGWFYPQGGWVVMRDLCEALLADTGNAVELHTRHTAEHLEYEAGNWQVHLQDGTALSTSTVVIATAHAAAQLLPKLSLEPVHGQLLQFRAPEAWQSLNCVIHAGHTLILLEDDWMCWGSTFRHHETEPTLIEEDTDLLLNDLHTVFPDCPMDDIRHTVKPWAGLRCTHPSRLPLIGAVPDQPEGLYLHIAHGSRGLLSGIFPFSITADYV